MSLRYLVNLGVSIANRQTKSLQGKVMHSAWIGDDRYGTSRFSSPISRDALINKKQQFVRGQNGELVLATAQLTFLEPIEPYQKGGFAAGFAPGFSPASIPGRTEPVDVRDLMVLPDGSTGQILAQDGFMDPVTARPFVTQIWLG